MQESKTSPEETTPATEPEQPAEHDPFLLYFHNRAFEAVNSVVVDLLPQIAEHVALYLQAQAPKPPEAPPPGPVPPVNEKTEYEVERIETGDLKTLLNARGAEGWSVYTMQQIDLNTFDPKWLIVYSRRLA